MILASVYHTVLAVIYVIYGIFMIPYAAYWTIVTLPSLTAQAAINPMLMMLDWADSSLWVRVGLILLTVVVGALSLHRAVHPSMSTISPPVSTYLSRITVG